MSGAIAESNHARHEVRGNVRILDGVLSARQAMDATDSKPESTATSDRFERLTEKIIGCAITVHRALGPGLLESIYRDCLVIELLAEHVRVQCDVPVPITYRG